MQEIPRTSWDGQCSPKHIVVFHHFNWSNCQVKSTREPWLKDWGIFHARYPFRGNVPDWLADLLPSGNSAGAETDFAPCAKGRWKDLVWPSSFELDQRIALVRLTRGPMKMTWINQKYKAWNLCRDKATHFQQEFWPCHSLANVFLCFSICLFAEHPFFFSFSFASWNFRWPR